MPNSWDVHRLRLVESAAPRLTPEERLAMNRAWDDLVRVNLELLRRAGRGVRGSGTGGPVRPGRVLGQNDVPTFRPCDASPATPRRCRPSSPPVLQPADDGRLLVGRMSNSTAAPDVGNCRADPSNSSGRGRPPDSPRALRRHAARELAEEAGIDTPPEDLTYWNVTRAGNGSIGVLFRAPSLPEARLRERFEEVVAAETAQGREPELNRIALIASTAQLPDLAGPHADYLEPIVRRYAESGGTGVSI
ncbi:NUDIX hydrolase [Streptomyces sp. L7]